MKAVWNALEMKRKTDMGVTLSTTNWYFLEELNAQENQ